jgi:hypothetical protein
LGIPWSRYVSNATQSLTCAVRQAYALKSSYAVDYEHNVVMNEVKNLIVLRCDMQRE